MDHPALCTAPHPALRAVARPVEAFAEEVRRLAHDLIETMYAHDGIGLAAPQIGRDVQVFVANPSQRRGSELVVVNPVLRGSRGRASVTEGCLSLPSIWARVRRASAVRLEGWDLAGKPLVVEAEGLLAIVLQHECDHLQGRLFIDRLPWLQRRRVEARLRDTAACA
ncbi:MAG: peptide deformylase [Candidatus Omnitrophica bacterium]|nr:peptide deformylase [Candidatus Omnitrophota bacterium]